MGSANDRPIIHIIYATESSIAACAGAAVSSHNLQISEFTNYTH
jgi:hypothetical protein